MTTADVTLLAELLKRGRAKALLDLIKGESKYTLDFEVDIPSYSEKGKAWRMAMEHLDFVSKYGLEESIVVDGSMTYAAYPEYFEAWLAFGAPGIAQEELDFYLKENPL